LGGGREAGKALTALGLNAARLAAMAPEAAFAEIAESISKIENPAQRASLAVDIFGKSGQNIINVLSMGKDGLAAYAAEADRLGVTLSQLDAEKAGAAKDALDKASAVMGGALNRAIADLSPVLEQAANRFAELAAQFLTTENVSPVIDAITFALQSMAEALEIVVAGLRELNVGAGGRGGMLAGKAAKGWQKVLEQRAGAESSGGDFAAGGSDFTNFADGGSDFGPSFIERMNALREKAIGLLNGETAAHHALAKAGQSGAFVFGALGDAVVGSLEAMAKAQAKRDEMMERGKAITEQMMTPSEQYAARMAELNSLLAGGAINQETFNRAATAAKEQLGGVADAAQELAAGPEAITRRFAAGMPGPRQLGAGKNPLEKLGEEELKKHDATNELLGKLIAESKVEFEVVNMN
jgi:hypothetical protein